MRDIDWLVRYTKLCLVNHRGKPPWELGMKPSKSFKKDGGVTKIWSKSDGFDDDWSWWEPLKK